MKIIVTGSAGYIGYNLCKKLLENGHIVTGIDNLDPETEFEEKQNRTAELQNIRNFEFIKLDVVNDAFPSIFHGKKYDYMVHLAAKDFYYQNYNHESKYNQYSPYLITNVVGTSKMMELAKNIGIKKFIYASTHSVYGKTKKGLLTEKKVVPKPISPHGASKYAAEQVVHYLSNLYRLDSVILRIFTVYGPGMQKYKSLYQIIDSLVKSEPYIAHGMNSLNNVRDYIYIDDAVNYIIESLNKRVKYQTINIAGENHISISKLADQVAEILGKKRGSLLVKDADNFVHKVIVKEAKADISRAKKILKYTPKTSLDEGLKKTVDWYFRDRTEKSKLFS